MAQILIRINKRGWNYFEDEEEEDINGLGCDGGIGGREGED